MKFDYSPFLDDYVSSFDRTKGSFEERNLLLPSIENIRDMMNERGIKTNKELSLLSGISTTSLSDIMAEKNKLTEDKARKIADALEVGVDWILYGDQEKKYFPVNGKMIEWLKTHPEERERIWEKMK